MKPVQFFILTILCLLLAACAEMRTASSIEQNSRLTQNYQKFKDYHDKSIFKVKTREAEFDYDFDPKNTSLILTQRITTGYDEGELLPKMILILADASFHLEGRESVSRNYIKTQSKANYVPSSRTETITEPGSVEIVTKADGTTEHVHRPATSKTVTINESKLQQSDSSEWQIFNSVRYSIDKESLSLLTGSPSIIFRVYAQNDSLDIFPNARQVAALKTFCAKIQAPQ